MDCITMIGLTLGALGLAATVGAWIYAWKTNSEKQDLRRLMQAELQGAAGNVQSVKQSAWWADRHFLEIRAALEGLDLAAGDPATVSKYKNDIIRHTLEGSRDAASADRMAANLLQELLSLQKGLFATEEISHPSKQETSALQPGTK